MEEAHQVKIWTKDFISIFLTQFLIFTVFYTLLTTLPIYVIHDLNESESKAGLVVTFMLVSAIIFRPFTAKIVDRIGKKNVLIIGVLLFFLSTISYLFAHNFIILSILRFIHGISFGWLSTITGVIVADIVPERRRGEGMGYFAMAMNIAVVVGPFIGLLLIQYVSFYHLFIILSIFMTVALVATLLVTTKEDPVLEKTSSSLKLSDLFEVKVFSIAFITGMVGFSYGSILSFVPVYADTLGLPQVASYFFLVFAIVMIVFRPYLGRAFDEKGPQIVLVPSLITFSIGLVLLSMSNGAALFLLAGGIIGLGYGTILPGFQTLTVQLSGPKRTSQGMSTFFTFYDLGIAIGAFTWGIISTTYGFSIMYLLSALIVFVAGIYFNFYMMRIRA